MPRLLHMLPLLIFLHACSTDKSNLAVREPEFYPDSRPWVRWWWFAGDIREDDIIRQLDWLKENNFGGVEIAWVFPRSRYDKTITPDSLAADWLSAAWTKDAIFTKQYCDKIGLGCDFTLGSAWPVAASYLSRGDQAKIYGDTNWRQYLTFSWNSPEIWPVLDHLDSAAFRRYSSPIADALSTAMSGSRSAFFTDSWEIKLNEEYKPWTSDFAQTFENDFGYDLIPFMDSLDLLPDIRYDYFMHLHKRVIEGFYKPYADFCRMRNVTSRVQCLASPTDVMTTYGLVDVPESEALLNEPHYSRIASSAAACSGKSVVSCEAFTCMYGFPGTYHRQEEAADLKLLADALFVQGVNHIFYHGMPFQSQGDSAKFFATVHVAPDGNLASDLSGLNTYFEKVCRELKRGKTYSQVAQYIPYEDAVMAGALPPDKRRVWVWGEYELRDVKPAKEIEGFHPVWINRDFLLKAKLVNQKLVTGDCEFDVLYVDCNHVDRDALSMMIDLAKEGFPVVFRRLSKQPGKAKSDYYEDMVRKLMGMKSVSTEIKNVYDQPPLVSGEEGIPQYWARWHGDELLIFFAHPKTKSVLYPMTLGQAYSRESQKLEVKVSQRGKTSELNLEFMPYQSLMYKFDAEGKATKVDIEYFPTEPAARPAEPQKFYF